jgi:hypothetical protein
LLDTQDKHFIEIEKLKVHREMEKKEEYMKLKK